MLRSKFRYIIILLCFVSLTSCFHREKVYQSGTYIGRSKGYYSELVVSVTVDEYNITLIEILESEEPPILADVVFEKLPPKIIKKNSTDVDEISGATYTSRALLKAVEQALDEARSTE